VGGRQEALLASLIVSGGPLRITALPGRAACSHGAGGAASPYCANSHTHQILCSAPVRPSHRPPSAPVIALLFAAVIAARIGP
jgi:hypothetical protein